MNSTGQGGEACLKKEANPMMATLGGQVAFTDCPCYCAAAELLNLVKQMHEYLRPWTVEAALGEDIVWERAQKVMERYNPATLQMSCVASRTMIQSAAKVA